MDASSLVPTNHWAQFNANDSNQEIAERDKKAVAETEDFLLTVQSARNDAQSVRTGEPSARHDSIQKIASTTLKFLENPANSKQLVSRIAKGLVDDNSNCRAMFNAFESLEFAFEQFADKDAQQVSSHIHEILDQVHKVVDQANYTSEQQIHPDALKKILENFSHTDLAHIQGVSKQFDGLSRKELIHKINQNKLTLSTGWAVTMLINRFGTKMFVNKRSEGLGFSSFKQISQYLGKELIDLQYLDLSNLKGSNDDLIEFIKHLKNIKEIVMNRDLEQSFCKISDEVFPHLARLPHVEKLVLADCPLTDQGIVPISKLKQLQELHFTSCKSLTPRALSDLAKLPNLKTLQINANTFFGTNKNSVVSGNTNENFEGTKFKKIENISINNNPITDQQLSSLLELTEGLQILKLTNCPKLTSQALSSVAKLSNLKELYWDVCVPPGPGLHHLANMHPLKILYLDHPNSAEEKSFIRQLQEKSPSLQIKFPQ